jgi:hypothetical protein
MTNKYHRYIHKWLLYSIIVSTLFVLFVLPNLVFAARSKMTTGTVVEVLFREVRGKYSSYHKRYPVFEYEVKGHRYYSVTEPYVFEWAPQGLKSTIIYNPNNPQDGRVNNFYGIWGKTFVWLLPTFLVITLSFLAINFIPTRIKIPPSREIDEKLFTQEVESNVKQ